MSYYVLNSDKTEGPYTLQQLREMWEAGLVTPQTLYCQDGFEAWIPLESLSKELQQPAVTPPAPIRSAAPSRHTPPRRIGLWIGYLIALLIVGFFVGIYIDGVSDHNNTLVALVLGFMAAVVYFLPTLVAESHRHRNSSAIMLINFFLGWTILGWVGAMVWAIYRERDAARY